MEKNTVLEYVKERVRHLNEYASPGHRSKIVELRRLMDWLEGTESPAPVSAASDERFGIVVDNAAVEYAEACWGKPHTHESAEISTKYDLAIDDFIEGAKWGVEWSASHRQPVASEREEEIAIEWFSGLGKHKQFQLLAKHNITALTQERLIALYRKACPASPSAENKGGEG